MKKSEAMEKYVSNLKLKLQNRYVIDDTNTHKIKLKDMDNPELILYTLVIKEGYLPNYFHTHLYNGSRTKVPLLNQYINLNKESELELLD